jgi:hypothetical protein
MQAIATTMKNQRGQSHDARTRALVRFNGLTFHSLAAASFLETAVPLHVNRIAPVFAAYPDVQLWLEQVWWAGRAELGRQLRGHVESTWPEFDWNAGYREFYDRYRPISGLRGGRATVAHEALGLCVTAAQAAVFYRALAHSADEPALRDLARAAAREHAGYFDYFRALFERCKRVERVGFGATWRTAIAISRSARDDDVAAAFQPLAQNWNGTSIVPGFGYPEYRERMAQFIQRHAALGPIERLLFRPWLERARAAPAPQAPVVRAGRWPSHAVQPGAA